MMIDRRRAVLALALAALAQRASADGLGDGPKKALKPIKGEFTNAYSPCGVPTDTLLLPGGASFPVCTTLVPSPCHFDSNDGKGKFSVKPLLKKSQTGASRLDLQAKAKITGLSPACTACTDEEGAPDSLSMVVDLQFSSTACGGGDACTTIPLSDLPIGDCRLSGAAGQPQSCNVAGAMEATLEAVAGVPVNLFQAGETYDVQIIGVGMTCSGDRALSNGFRLGA